MDLSQKRWVRPAAWIAAALAAVVPLFARLGLLPIRQWDESRLAINALEMARGQSAFFVPTYLGQPDLWNTKPPLLIWTQALFLRLLGPSEWALRLPSALAAAATCFLLLRLAQRWLQRPWLGALAVCVLVTSAGYISIHGVRTGDYDAMLTLFTTGYGIAWFLASETGRRGLYYTAGACLAGAVLTKGIAGLLPVPALLLYSVLRGQLVAQLRNRHVWGALLFFLGVSVGYYALRETLNPGYLAAIRANELGGRFAQTQENHGAVWNWYLLNLRIYRFKFWLLPWGAGLLLGIASKDRMLRCLTLFSLLFCSVQLAVISSSQTKLEWYDLPVYPFAALTVATGLYRAGQLAWRALPQSPARLVVPVALAALFLRPYSRTAVRVWSGEPNFWEDVSENDAGVYLQQVQRGQRPVRPDAFAWTGYHAHLSWYVALLQPRLPLDDASRSPDRLRSGMQVYSFQPEVQAAIVQRYAADTVDRLRNVVVYRIR